MPVTRLSLLDEYQCAASACPDNCCPGPWEIPVDWESHDLWTVQPSSAARTFYFDNLNKIEEHDN